MLREILIGSSNTDAHLALAVNDHHLGNLDSQCDWGFAKDYVEGMWLMLQAENYGFAIGQPHTIQQFLGFSFRDRSRRSYQKQFGETVKQ